MKLYPALLAVSAGLCLMMPAMKVRAHLSHFGSLDDIRDDPSIVGMTIAGLVLAPVLAFLVWLPLKAIVTAWKRVATRGNSARNASGSETLAPGNAPSAPRG